MSVPAAGNRFRSLAVAWAVLLLVLLLGAIVLQWLGPPEHIRVATSAIPTALLPGAATIPPPEPPPPPPALPGGQIADPDPALLEPSPLGGDLRRPRIAADGRASFSVYARAAEPAGRRPRVAMVVTGFGLSAADSSAAIAALPPAVTLGVSPYTLKPDPLLKEARSIGHEFLVTLPMESQGYPLNQSGTHALLTGADPFTNDQNLQWVLSRMQGEVGLTGASDGLRGERFANATVPFGVVLNELGGRGLLYLDPRPDGRLPAANGRVATASVVVDEQPAATAIDARLAQLEEMARDRGSAIGLAGPLRPVMVARVAAWARALDSHGIDLVPLSALAAARVP